MRKKEWKSSGEGTLTFANGKSVDGAWLFPCTMGFTASRLRRALVAEARKKKIPGRSKVVRFDCTVRPT